MAEVEEGQEGQTVGLDENRLSEMMQEKINAAFEANLARLKEATASSAPSQTGQTAQQTEENPFDQWVQKATEPGLRAANFAAAAARDESSFYRSRDWGKVADLVDDGTMTEDEVKQGVEEYEKKIEEQFNKLAQQGQFVPRAGILKYLLGEELTSSTKIAAKIAKKHTNTENAKLNKARANSDIGAATSTNLNRQDIYAMPDDKFDQLFNSTRI